MKTNLEEARGFAESLEAYVGGLCYLGDKFQAAMLKKASEVINSLVDEIEVNDVILQETENGKEKTSPHTPIKRK